MATPIWLPGAFYNPGAIVRRASAPSVVQSAIINAGFEGGDTGWTKGAGWTIVNQQAAGFPTRAFSGIWSAQFAAAINTSRIVNHNTVPVVPGQSITASCMARRGVTRTPSGFVRVELDWLTAGLVLLSTSLGNALVISTSYFKLSTVTAVAPVGAAFARVAAYAQKSIVGMPLWVDAFSWNYTQATTDANLVFRAVQVAAGFSGPIEPIWPNVVGQQVIDNAVAWQAVTSSKVVWEANPILVSSYYEPVWPLEVGGSVRDGTIIWTAISRRVSDVKCPNTAVVAMAASKMFAGDKDIIGFSATVNPLDWTTKEDAGYLPFGLQTFGGNPVAALGLYRTNLMAFNSEGFQMWQVDEDPSNMALLDAAAVGCIWPRTIFPVHNDLVFLSNVGVRNISIAGASTNLQAGTFGEAIDPLVLAAIRAGTYKPFGFFVPAYGQYWLVFGPEAFVLTISDVKKQSWSRYVFPEVITDWTLEGGVLLLRTVNHRVWRFSPAALYDDQQVSAPVGGANAVFNGTIWWPYLDFNSIGIEKMFGAVDLTATAPGGVKVSIGYDQRNQNLRTADHTIDADTLPVQQVPIPCAGPSFDVRLTFTGGFGKWEWSATVISVEDMRQGT